MGEQAAGQTAQGYCAGVPGRFRSLHHREEAGDVCTIQPGPKGENEEDRLSPTGR